MLLKIIYKVATLMMDCDPTSEKVPIQLYSYIATEPARVASYMGLEHWEMKTKRWLC